MTRHLIGGPGWATYCGMTGLTDPATITGFVTSVTCEPCLTSAREQGHIR